MDEMDVIIEDNVAECELIGDYGELVGEQSIDEDFEQAGEESESEVGDVIEGVKQKDYRGQFDHVLCGRKTGVYVKLNSAGFVTEVGSDIFIDNLDGWTKIDEGEGDRFVHAQTQYFDTPIVDELGHYKYKLK